MTTTTAVTPPVNEPQFISRYPMGGNSTMAQRLALVALVSAQSEVVGA